MKKALLSIGAFMASATLAFASTVQVPGNSTGRLIKDHVYNEDISLAVVLGYESTERDLDTSGEEAEFDVMSVKLSLDYKEKYSFYTVLGQTSDASFKEVLGVDSLQYFLEDKFMWGIGASAVFYDDDNGLKVFGDINYREASEMGVEEFDLNGTRYSLSQFDASVSAEADWEEFQVALGVSKTFDGFTPYAGVKYSDVDAKSTTRILGTTYTATSGADENVGLFAGVMIQPTEGFAVDFQGRFLDETSFTVAATFKF